jgi:hypothetical protein
MNKALKISVEYVLWDYQEDKPVVWGRRVGKATANLFINRNDWLKNIRSVTSGITSALPFKAVH